MFNLTFRIMIQEMEMWDGFVPSPTFGELPPEFVEYLEREEQP